MSKDKNKIGKPEELKHIEFKFLLVYSITNLLSKALGVTLWLGVAYFIYLSIDSLADKTTLVDANIIFSMFISRENDYGLPWLIAFISFVFGVAQTWLRYRKTEEMQKHILELETHIDPQRTSSGLTARGETNPKDNL
ncbi:MAG: hypothetical protein K2Q45_06475 [Nitrosomonas sp.]|nr:hypothetical protein [Nitrosomonas sp.]